MIRYRIHHLSIFLSIGIQAVYAGDQKGNHIILQLQDPWLSYYDRFSEDHIECSPVSGSLWIQPSYARVLAYFDDTQKDPMILSLGSLESDPKIIIANNSCSIILSISRSLGWDRLNESAPSSLSSKSQSLPRFENPGMMVELHYKDDDYSCSGFEIPFFINRNNITWTQSSSFNQGYRISSRGAENGNSFMHILEKPGCKITLELRINVKVSSDWKNETFRH